MAENDTTTPESGAAETAKPSFSVQRLYLKDASYEAPCMPAALAINSEWKPEISLDINTRVQKLNDAHYEVVLRVTATGRTDGKEAFVIEVQYAGVFKIENMEEAQLQHSLGAFCPNILFPYVRETVDSLAVRGGLVPLTLAPVNFEAVYQQQRQNEDQAPTAH